MPEFYKKLIEIYEAYSTLNIQDLALPIFGGLWLLTLFVSLKGIHRRDLPTGATYTAYLLASGVILLFILPSQHILQPYSSSTQCLMIASLFLIIILRWWLREDTSLPKTKIYTAYISDEVSE